MVNPSVLKWVLSFVRSSYALCSGKDVECVLFGSLGLQLLFGSLGLQTTQIPKCRNLKWTVAHSFSGFY